MPAVIAAGTTSANKSDENQKSASPHTKENELNHKDLPEALVKKVAPFGTVLGITDGPMEVYSCDYDSVDSSKYPSRESFASYHEGILTGFKYQCVELARRYLLINHRVIFDSIPMAYNIFDLKYVRRASDKSAMVPMSAHPNGDQTLPVKGSLLIWKSAGFFHPTGHVAVIVDVQPTHVDIVEQNVEDAVWAPGTNYSRRLRAELKPDGSYVMHCTFADTAILGWMNIDYTSEFNYDNQKQCKIKDLTKQVFTLPECVSNIQWLDEDKEAVKAFIEKAGSNIAERGGSKATYYTLTSSGEAALEHATEELHHLFLNATDYVINHHDSVGKYFHIPPKLWPKIRRSWYQRNKDIVAGRFDFAITADGIKVYEYNADSASCLMECGYIQQKWAEGAGIGKIGRDAGPKTFSMLVEAWKDRKVEGLLHFMRDTDPEEAYHTLYMKSAAEAAGIRCKVIVGVEGLSWTESGDIVDADKDLITNVWKTWSWQTAFNQLSESELFLHLDQADQLESDIKSRDLSVKPKLVDVLLHFKIRTFEPLWTVIPSCKSILPVLWQLYPNHPYLLQSSFELTKELKEDGYVTKPVTGRGGKNIQIFHANGSLIDQSPGQWSQDPQVYQELCMLPKYDQDHVQVCCWAIRGRFGGTVLRVDESSIIGYESSVHPLRVVE